MKPSIKVSILAAFALFVFLFSAPEKAAAQRGMNISFQTFYDELSPYGEWIHNPRHGYVWVPYAEPGFQPYGTRGYWAVTEYGNTWVSDYEWGWAPFHYGRWFYDDYYGWSWVPGTEWGPSWVHWRHNDGYYGWAPLGPGVHFNMTIHIPVHHWVFVPNRYITSYRIYDYYVPRRRVNHIYHNTVVINNIYVNNNNTYISGPSRQDIERRTRRPVTVRTIDNADRPDRSTADSRSVRIYRPAVSEDTRSSAKPSRISDGSSRTSRTSIANRDGQVDRSRTSVNRVPNTATDRKGTNTESSDRTPRMSSSDNTNSRTSPSSSGTGERVKRTETRTAVKNEGNRTNNITNERRSTRQEAQRSVPVERRQEVQRSAPVQKRQEMQRSAPVQNRQEVQRTAPVQRSQEIQRSAPVKRQQEMRTTTSSPSRQNRQSKVKGAQNRDTQRSSTSQRAPQSTQSQRRTR